MPARRKELNISGPDLWYLVGLITSDGCLSSDGRHIDITSKDYGFLEAIKNRFGFKNKIGNKYNSKGQLHYHLQLSNRSLYEFLQSVGLTPHKSLTLGELNVPEDYFYEFLRGLIDGDGCIRRWIHPTNLREQWNLRIYSGSVKFATWLEKETARILRVKGVMHKNDKNVWVLKFGKMAAREISRRCYYKGCFSLTRKAILARECIDSYQGWRNSKTLLS